MLGRLARINRFFFRLQKNGRDVLTSLKGHLSMNF